jgi:hypothetical protein
MKPIFLLITSLLLAAGLGSQTLYQSPSTQLSWNPGSTLALAGPASGFVRVYSELGGDVCLYGLTPSGDGNFYLTGLKSGLAFLAKMEPDGDLLWVRTLDFGPAGVSRINHVIVDSDGMVAGAGHTGAPDPAGPFAAFAFRYDPVAQSMLWATTWSASTYVSGIEEISTNGQFIVYTNPHEAGVGDDAEFVGLDRATGTLVPGLTRRFQFGSSDQFQTLIEVGGALYGVGRFTYGNSFSTMRHTIAKFGLDGVPYWIYAGPVGPSEAARVYGRDLIFDGVGLVSTFSGNEAGDDLTQTRIFLQKNKLGDGIYQWTQRFVLPEIAAPFVEELVAVPDGYVMLGRTLTPGGSVFIVKTDLQGQPQWAKKLAYGLSSDLNQYVQNELQAVGDTIYFTATAVTPTGAVGVLVKMPASGDVGDCPFLVATPIVGESFAASQQELIASHPLPEAAPTALTGVVQAAALADTVLCGTLVDPCDSTLVPPLALADLTLCPGESATVSAPGFASYLWSPAAGLSCTTCATVTVQPQVTTAYTLAATTADGCVRTDTFLVAAASTFVSTVVLPACEGDTLFLLGNAYTANTTVIDSFQTTQGCDSLIHYVLLFTPAPTATQTIARCQGESFILEGIAYTADTTLVSTLPAATGCDTVVTYQLTFTPLPASTQAIARCQGESFILDGVAYITDTTVLSTLPAATGCDTVVTYQLTFAPLPTTTQSIARCQGEAFILDGIAYTADTTLVSTLPAMTGCDTVATYQLTFEPLPTATATIEFAPGDTVVLGGTGYTEPGMVTVAVSSTTGGCDTLVTYTLVLQTELTLTCPADITVDAPAGMPMVMVNYDDPVAAHNCPDGGLVVTRTQGPAANASFMPGTTGICFLAVTACGDSATCCFDVTVVEQPCDTKTTACVRYDLLSIAETPEGDRTYRVRVTNFCGAPLLYTAIQVPNGTEAVAPANNATYTAPSGRGYTVRNPNAQPFHSIRFKAQSMALHSGAADILAYTFDEATDPYSILVTSRLANGVFFEAHLNTFNCVVQPHNDFHAPGGGGAIDKPAPAEAASAERAAVADRRLLLFPNPTTGRLWLDLTDWDAETVVVAIYNAQGRRVQEQRLTGRALAPIELADGLVTGLYVLAVESTAGKAVWQRFVLVR